MNEEKGCWQIMCKLAQGRGEAGLGQAVGLRWREAGGFQVLEHFLDDRCKLALLWRLASGLGLKGTVSDTAVYRVERKAEV